MKGQMPRTGKLVSFHVEEEETDNKETKKVGTVGSVPSVGSPKLPDKTQAKKRTATSVAVPAPTLPNVAKTPPSPVKKSSVPVTSQKGPTEVESDVPEKPKWKEFVRSEEGSDRWINELEDLIPVISVPKRPYSGVLYAGDPGIGKTQFVYFLARVLGLDIIVIEAPFIVEEHLINIPFFEFTPSGTKTSGVDTIEIGDQKDPKQYDIVLAKSHLYSRLVETTQMPDNQYINEIYQSGDKNLIKAFEAFGGSPRNIPKQFKKIRSKFKAILFLDEYLRQTSATIRNMLRQFLNKRIGMHTLPEDVLIMYASNVNDEGIDRGSRHQQFYVKELTAPTIKAWLNYFYNKFEKTVDIKKDVIDTFFNLLKDENLSETDMATGIRNSPRRWEQLLLYINASLPVENEKEARGLITNVSAMFTSISDEKKKHYIADAVIEATKSLIEKTSNINTSSFGEFESHEWEQIIDHQIKTKMKLGEDRKYIPVVSGLPGVGKTGKLSQIALDNDLVLISIECPGLSADDVIGMPLPRGRQEEMGVDFSLPILYKRIQRQIAEEEERYFNVIRQEYRDDPRKAEAKIKQFENKRWKYIIFFDELNRVKNEQVFNALRRVILEKSFGPVGEGGRELKLPEGSIVIAAINPNDAGIVQFTEHLKDVLDFVDAQYTWPQAKAYIAKKHSSEFDKENVDVVLSIVDKFLTNFSIVKKTDHELTKKIEPGMRYFFLDIGEGIYVSPRELDDVVQFMLSRMDFFIDQFGSMADIVILPAKEQEQVIKKLATKLAEVFLGQLTWATTNAGIDDASLLFSTFKKWVESEAAKELKNMLTTATKRQSSSTFTETFARTVKDQNFHLWDDSKYVNFIQGVTLGMLQERLYQTLESMIDSQDKAISMLLIPSKKNMNDLYQKASERGAEVFESEEFDLGSYDSSNVTEVLTTKYSILLMECYIPTTIPEFKVGPEKREVVIATFSEFFENVTKRFNIDLGSVGELQEKYFKERGMEITAENETLFSDMLLNNSTILETLKFTTTEDFS